MTANAARAGVLRPAAALDARVVVASRGVDVALEVPAGETLAIVGANGAGKTTVVEAIAGIVVPDAGSVRLGERMLHDRAIGGRAWTPVHRRRIGLLDQRPLLFGGRTVLDAVAFPLRAAGLSMAAARASAHARPPLPLIHCSCDSMSSSVVSAGVFSVWLRRELTTACCNERNSGM